MNDIDGDHVPTIEELEKLKTHLERSIAFVRKNQRKNKEYEKQGMITNKRADDHLKKQIVKDSRCLSFLDRLLVERKEKENKNS